MAWRGSGVRIPLAPRTGILTKVGIPFFMRKRLFSNDSKTLRQNMNRPEKYAKVHKIGAQIGPQKDIT